MTKTTSRPHELPRASKPRQFWLFPLVCIGVYVLVLGIYIPSTSLGPSSLDDETLLRAAAGRSFGDVFSYDVFGQLRPWKNLWFGILARSPERLSTFRGLLLACFVAVLACAQRYASIVLGSRWWALLTMLWWALNPTTLSVVCWLSAHNTVICTLGVLGYLILKTTTSTETPSGWKSAAAYACLFVAVLSHELAVVAPLLALAHDRLFNAQAPRPRVARTIAEGLFIAAPLLALRLSQHAPTQAYRFAARAAWLMVTSSARYLFENVSLWLWPARFGVLLVDTSVPWALNGACLLAAVSFGTALWHYRKHVPSVAFGGLFCCVFLVPVINVIPLGNTPVAVHYMFLPGFGLSLALTGAAQALARRMTGTLRTLLPVVVVAASTVSWTPALRNVLAAWADEEQLYTITLHNYPDNIEVRLNLSSVYLERNELGKADALLRESLTLAPHHLGLVRNYFQLLWQRGQADLALAWLDSHEGFDTSVYLARRAKLLEKLARNDAAVSAWQQALATAQASQERFAAGYNLATALVRIGRLEEGSRLIDQLLVEFPDRPELIFTQRLLAEER